MSNLKLYNYAYLCKWTWTFKNRITYIFAKSQILIERRLKVVWSSGVSRSAAYWPCRINFFVWCITRHLKENFLKVSAESIQPFRRSGVVVTRFGNWPSILVSEGVIIGCSTSKNYWRFFLQVRVDFVDTEMLSPVDGECQDQYLVVSGSVWTTGQYCHILK